MSQDAYGPVGTRTLLTTGTMTVWEIRLAAREELAMHHHRHPYLVVHTSGGHLRVTELGGQVIEREVTAGMVDWHAVGEIHELANLASQPYTNVVIELTAPISPTDSEPHAIHMEETVDE
jgi:beta-alanine degradation protein BauB